MYYLELIEKFWEFNQKQRVGSMSIALYLYLLKLGYDNNTYEFNISDSEISNVLGITRNSVKPVKEKLRNLGLIEYNYKKGFACHYRILLNYQLQIPKIERELNVKFESESLIPTTEEVNNSHFENIMIQDDRVEKRKESCQSEFRKPTKLSNRPSFKEFMDYAQTLKHYEEVLDFKIKEKYESWTKNEWCNALGRPITNWKSSLKNTLPYMKNTDDDKISSVQSLPRIKPPIS